ncbi:hypothetical protein DMC30DRAFT_446846 [Rhodotorula diobovata]|uniref:Proteophosphoglycan ppg4 n=1 Tax=Rhodotorula diobovata TaxID=5288 RepID=A0A5C5FXH2_9BASI|nr:hypothetical protein DMC30DRAFT_446846 [Rhodotorula diobovata]
MDDDLRTLHGVASIHSDSGYASTSSHPQHQPGSHQGARHAPRPTATASLNARLDRLTRDMASLANSSPQTAGASLGITRKTIMRHPTAASEASSRTPREHRVEQYSPPPSWLLHRLSAPSRAHDLEPAPAAPRLDSFAPPDRYDASPLGGASLDQHAAYAYPLSPLYPSSTHVPFFGDPTPLPFSTSGRLAPPAPIVSPPPSPSRTQVPLYEAQLARDIPLFRSTTPEHRFHPPIAASSFSHPHALATHHETPVARHATPDTIFGQPFAELASVYGDARAPLSGYFPSSPPHSMAFDSFTPRPSSPECDGLYDRFGVPVQPASFWQPGPHPPALHAPTPTPGRARYAAILERSAAQQLQPAVARRSPSDAPESGAAPRSDEQNVPLEGLSHSRTSAAQDRRGADTSAGSELREDGAPPSAQLSDNGEASSAAKRGHPIRVELAQPQPQAHAPAHTHAHANPRTPTPAQQRTHRPAPAPPDAHTLHAATRVSAHGPSSEAGRSSAAGGLDGYEAGGEGAKADGGEGTGVAQGKEEETGWTIWEDEDEIEEV